MRRLFTSLACESNETVQSKETEVVVYAKVTNPEGLEQASFREEQYQLEGEFSGGVKCRVRRTTKDSKVSYEFTYKLKQNDDGEIQTCQEFNVEVDEDFFNGFKSIAKKAVNKTRYVFFSENISLTYTEDEEEKTFVIPNLEYEVDIYTKEDGIKSEWCKIDIEVDNLLNYLSKDHPDLEGIKLNIRVSHLPFAPSNPILVANASEEEHKFLGNLWDTEFNVKV